jgi:hypothetical protein
MRSKVAQRIQNETPEEVRIFVRQYTGINNFKAKGYTQKDLAEKMNKKPSEINKWQTKAPGQIQRLYSHIISA